MEPIKSYKAEIMSDVVKSKLLDNYFYSTSIDDYVIFANASHIPKCLKEYRLFRNKSLRDVEAATGVSNAYISQLENGKVSKPSFEVVVKLCTFYNVKLTI